MKKKMLVISAALMLGLVGCGEATESIDDYGKAGAETDSAKNDKASKDDSKKDDKDAEEKGESDKDIKLGANGMPEHITCVLGEDGKTQINVDADVCSLGIEDAQVYKIEKIEIDDAYLIDLATKLFDDGKFTAVLPYKYWEAADLDAENQRFQLMEDSEEVQEKGYELNHHFLEDLKKASLGNKASKQPTALGPDKIIYEDEASGMCPFLYNNDRFAKLRGNIDGKEYELSYWVCDGVKSGDISSLRLRALFPVADTDAIDGSSNGENPGRDGSLEKKANAIMQKLGFDKDFVLGLSQDRVCKNRKTQETFYDGMEFHYVRAIGGLSNSLVEYVDVIDYQDMEKNLFTETPQEFVDIAVSPEGIVGIDFSVHYNIGEVLSSETKLLDFEQLMDVMEEYTKTQKKKINTYYQYLDYIRVGEVNDIRLSYMPVQYNDQFVYMPMWCVSRNSSNTTIFTGTDFTGMCAIGAFDGKVYLFDWAQIEN